MLECVVSGVEPLFAANDDPDMSFALREVHHRTANTLALLAATLRSDFAALTDPAAPAVLRRQERRIVAFGDLHRRLAIGPGAGEVAVESYIRPLCQSLALAILAPLGIHCEVFVGDSSLTSARCESRGLIVAKLVTNAAKHAFPAGTKGRVRVEIVEGADVWRCVVSDDGVGLRGAVPGAGSRILEMLIRTLQGRIERCPGSPGTTVVITFPRRSSPTEGKMANVVR